MSEHDEQAAIFAWAALLSGAHRELELLRADNNGAALKGGARAWAKLKAAGAKAGFPDIFLPVARHNYHGLFVELKCGRNKPSDKQVEWLDRLQEQGYLAVAAWGADEAIEIISEYLEIR